MSFRSKIIMTTGTLNPNGPTVETVFNGTDKSTAKEAYNEASEFYAKMDGSGRHCSEIKIVGPWGEMTPFAYGV